MQARQLLAASIGLIAFLALAGFALDRAFVDVASEGLRERLKSYAFAYAGGIEFLRNGEIYVPELPPDERFERPNGGLYAIVELPNGRWTSGSARGPQLPSSPMLGAREESFAGPLPIVTSDGRRSKVYRYGMGLIWAPGGPQSEFPYTIYILQDAGMLPRQVRVFRQALWSYLA
ncbi:MAG: two-component sensor histidine kinase, partial [Gammaproteobacteria bacterium]|nr:two-component sensor histidine kinase [Gammaproteobacteria bacterium]